MLNTVYTTGESYSAQGVSVTLPRNGKVEIVHINVVYEAYRETNGIITRVIAMTIDVTEQVVARKKMEAQALMVENMLITAPGFVCTLVGPNHVYDLVNPMAQQMFGTRKIKGFTVKDILPELEGQGLHELLDNVYNTGETFIGVEEPCLNCFCYFGKYTENIAPSPFRPSASIWPSCKSAIFLQIESPIPVPLNSDLLLSR